MHFNTLPSQTISQAERVRCRGEACLDRPADIGDGWPNAALLLGAEFGRNKAGRYEKTAHSRGTKICSKTLTA
jgi:hypothetical protein